MNDFLIHYGILGMKWGVRRYQNPDGTLTEAGKIRDRKNNKTEEDYVKNGTKRASVFSKVVTETTPFAKGVSKGFKNKQMSSMTEEQLKAYIKKSKLENQYKISKGINPDNNKSKMDNTIDAFGVAADKLNKKYEKIANAETAKKAKTMSDQELRDAINRLNLERQYRDLSKADRESGANYVYNRNKELVKDLIIVSTPIVTTIVAPLLMKKLLK